MINGNGQINENKIFFTKIKLKVLKFINQYIKKYNYSPTCLEVGRAMNFSRARAGKILGELYELGFINKGTESHRKMTLTLEQKKLIKKLKINKDYNIKQNRLIKKKANKENLING
jgi:SOS-response transcriptional repressor LexA